MKKLGAIVLFFLTISIASSAQDQPGPPQHKQKSGSFDPSKLTFGGMVGAWFGPITNVNLSPTIGYRFTKKYEAGLGPVYMYFDNHVTNASVYGGTLYSRFYIADFLFAHVMYQPLNGPFDPYINGRFWLNNVWVGGGLKDNLGRGGVYVMVLVNINEVPTIDFPHSPWIAIGFML